MLMTPEARLCLLSFWYLSICNLSFLAFDEYRAIYTMCGISIRKVLQPLRVYCFQQGPKVLYIAFVLFCFYLFFNQGPSFYVSATNHRDRWLHSVSPCPSWIMRGLLSCVVSEVSEAGQCWGALLSESSCQSGSQNTLLTEALAMNHASTSARLVGLEKQEPLSS